MKIKILYRKNLKMSTGKLAAVCCHIGKELGKVCGDTDSWEDIVIVLSVSDKKFLEARQELVYNENPYHLHIDRGFSEVSLGTDCALGWIEEM